MIGTHELKRWALALAMIAAVCTAPAIGQDDEEDDGTGLYVDFGVFIAKPNGLGYRPATEINPIDAGDTQVLPFDVGTESEYRAQVGYILAGWGELKVDYFEHETKLARTESNPGNYVYGALDVFPLYAGFNNDGLADAFSATARVSHRDARITVARPAFENPQAIGKWYIGIRRIQHNRESNSEYFALLTDLPIFSDPLCGPNAPASCPALDPFSDVAQTASRYRGRGIEGGLEVDFPLFDNKLIVETGLGAAAMFGDVDTNYRSQTAFYQFTGPGGIVSVLEAPYDTIDDPAVFGNTLQRQFDLGVNQVNTTVSSLVIDGWLGLRASIWRSLDFFVGYRITNYGDVAIELRPDSAATIGGTNVNSFSEQRRSVTYEGIYTGLGFEF